MIKVISWIVPYYGNAKGDAFMYVNEWLFNMDGLIDIKKMFMTPISKKEGCFWIWYETKGRSKSEPTL